MVRVNRAVNDILIELEKAGLGVQLNNGKSIGGLLFADDCGYE